MTALARRLPLLALALLVGVLTMMLAIRVGVSLAGADTGSAMVVDAGPGIASGPDLYVPAREGFKADPAPSPIDTSKMTVETAWDLVEQYGPIWGGMLLLFGGAVAFLRRNEKEQWIKQGRRLAIVTAFLGVLGSVLEAGVNGGTWAGVIATAFVAVKLLFSPTPFALPKVAEG